jgi:DMSO/TMAO reductase YedYZ molybdopterin-dependent catalytic subunit
MSVQRQPRWALRTWRVASSATVVLAATLVVLLTGVFLYWLRTGLPPLWLGRLVLAVHVYVGLAALPFVALKVWLTWGRFLYLAPRDSAARLDLWASRSIVGLVVAVNATGLQLQYQVPPFSKSAMALVHLALTYLLLVPVLWHLQRYLATTLSWLVAPDSPRQADPAARLRRRLLWGGATLLGGLVVFRLPAALAARHGDAAGTAGDVGELAGGTAAQAASGPLPALDRGTPTGGDRDGPATVPAARDANDFPVTGHRLDFGAIDAASWRLRIVGDVAQPRTFTYAELLAMPSVRFSYPLECPLSFEIVRQWTGVSLKGLLELAAPAADFGLVVAKSDDGFDSTLRSELDRPSVMVCTHVNGVPLAEEHGYPIRLMMPGVAGERCVKWLQEFEVKRHA